MRGLIVGIGMTFFPLLTVADTLPGTLQWASPLDLSTPRSGVVRDVPVSVGDRVNQDTVLVRLEARDVEARLLAATAAVNQTRQAMEEAGRERDRTQELYDRTLLSDHDLQLAKIAFLETEVAYKKALAARARARLAVEYSNLKAPFPALILEVRVQPGQAVVNRLAVTPMIRLVRSDRLRVTAPASLAQVETLRTGQSLKVRMGAEELAATLVDPGLVPQHESGAPHYPISVEFLWPEQRNWRAGQPAEIVLP